ncbi:MAG: VPA1267 family protein [Gallionella sp.]|nr:VPA1267 family protein [Gallionella sp.]
MNSTGAVKTGLNGREIAANNLQRFKIWIDERDAVGDWADYIRDNKLNRSEIATECGFALSVVRQNPAVKNLLEILENRLRSSGTLGPSKSAQNISHSTSDSAASHATDRRIMEAKGKAEARVKALEEQNAALRAEVHDLSEKLKRYKHLDDHLCNTGRFLHS